MKIYVKCSRSNKAKWIKVDTFDYRYCVNGDENLEIAQVWKQPSARLWTVSTDNFTSVENTVGAAKMQAEKLLEQEAHGIIDWMQRCGYSSEEMQQECETNPVLIYFGITI